MSEMLGWVIIVLVVVILSMFLIARYLDVLDTKEMKSEKEAERKKAFWTFRSVRRGK